jgi:hypothetical protein
LDNFRNLQKLVIMIIMYGERQFNIVNISKVYFAEVRDRAGYNKFKMSPVCTWEDATYCGIINVRGFRGSPLPTNLHPKEPVFISYKYHYSTPETLCKLPTKLRPHERVKFWSPTNIDPHESK